ncbi:replicative DNA helicase [Atopobiaceae bacterium 24-176]
MAIATVPAPSFGAAPPSMPQDIDAEKSVLSAMILSQDVLQECLVELEDTDFYLPRNQVVYQTLRDMFDNSLPIDPLSLADRLQSAKKLESVGGPAYLAELAANTFSLSSWKHHAEMLRRDSTLRQIITSAAQITSLAFDAPEDTKEVVDSAERMILSVTDRDVRSNYITMQDAMQSLYAEIQAQAESGEEIMGVKTGFPRLDDMLLGMREGQMVVVGARPGVGKTSFALNLAVQAAEAGATVAFFSLEMSSTEIAQRLLSAYSQVPLKNIRSAKIAGEDWARLMDASARLSQLDILIDDTPGTTVTEVRAKARRMLRNKEKAVVILDYLQLVSPPPSKRSDSRATEVSEMSRGIKIMAKDLRVPVVALSQLNRTSENRTGKRPQLSDLRESGSIEQDADIVILLDRSATPEEAERSDRPDEGITEFIVAKNRSGPVGTIEMVFLKENTRFMQLDRNHDA